MLRVVAGKYKGRKLNTLAGEHTKPTKDMVKEALFSSLGPLYGKQFLDLFSGSGSIGIEALSRGADAVTFVDNSPEAISVIRDNLKMLEEKRDVFETNAIDYLKSTNNRFDIVYIDPPYHFDDIGSLFAALKENNRLSKDAVIVYEAASDEDIVACANGYKLLKEKKYGITKLFYFKEETAE